MHKKICCYCHKEYTTRKKKQKYCSPECQHNALKIKGVKGICKYCGKEFFYKPYDCKGIFCSRKCSTDAIRAKQSEMSRINKRIKYSEQQHKLMLYEELYNQLVTLTNRYQSLIKSKCCVECNKLFIANDVRQKYCSTQCRNKHSNRIKNKRLYKNGKPDMSISLTRLYMRDSGICQLCGKHINFDCDSNSNNYPSIDHIKPIAKGGLHSWDNVQLACRQCNSIKSDSF